MFQRALDGFEKVLGPDHTSTLSTVGHLIVLCACQCRLNEAWAMFQRALDSTGKMPGPVYGWSHVMLKESEAMCRRALEGMEMVRGLIRTWRLDMLKEPKAMCGWVPEGMEKALGPDHTSTLYTRVGSHINSPDAQLEVGTLKRKVRRPFSSSEISSLMPIPPVINKEAVAAAPQNGSITLGIGLHALVIICSLYVLVLIGGLHMFVLIGGLVAFASYKYMQQQQAAQRA